MLVEPSWQLAGNRRKIQHLQRKVRKLSWLSWSMIIPLLAWSQIYPCCPATISIFFNISKWFEHFQICLQKMCWYPRSRIVFTDTFYTSETERTPNVHTIFQDYSLKSQKMIYFWTCHTKTQWSTRCIRCNKKVRDNSVSQTLLTALRTTLELVCNMLYASRVGSISRNSTITIPYL